MRDVNAMLGDGDGGVGRGVGKDGGEGGHGGLKESAISIRIFRSNGELSMSPFNLNSSEPMESVH